MRKLFFLLFSFTFYYCSGQQVRFQIKRITQCDTVGKIDLSNYFLIDADDSNYYNQSDAVILPKPGKYTIKNWSEPSINLTSIIIEDTGLFIYTYYEPKMVLRTYGMHPHSVYEICGNAIEGFQQDYYSNGNVRIRGNFIKGNPKDSVVTFYPNGVTKKRVTYLAKELLIEDFDSLSNLLFVSHNSNKAYYLTDYKSTAYYPNGEILKKESCLNKRITIKEFYPNGKIKINQTKKKRTEYYENGNKKIAYTWKQKKEKTIPGEYDFTFTISKKIFDETGLLLESQLTQDWNGANSQPNLVFEESNWIIKWVKWDNGKEIIIAKDVETKEYLKNHPELE